MPDDTAPTLPAPVVIHLPRALLALFPGAVPRLELSAENVNDMIDQLNARWPGMRDRLCDSTPGIRRHINVFVEGERATLTTALPPGAQVYVLTAMTGG